VVASNAIDIRTKFHKNPSISSIVIEGNICRKASYKEGHTHTGPAMTNMSQQGRFIAGGQELKQVSSEYKAGLLSSLQLT